jgi:hypothetical protein
MYYSTDAENRAEFIAALRAMADFLAANPAVPVPLYGDQITLCADSFEDGGKAQVDHIASVLSGTITDDTGNGGHYQANRDFGPLTYTAVAIPEACKARFDTEKTYRGYVTPDFDPDTVPQQICCEACLDSEQCESCREAQEFENRRFTVRRTNEAAWL